MVQIRKRLGYSLYILLLSRWLIVIWGVCLNCLLFCIFVVLIQICRSGVVCLCGVLLGIARDGYITKKALDFSKAFLVGAEGVEPPTLCL